MTDPTSTGSDDDTIPWSGFVAEARQRLARAGVADPTIEARWLVEEAAGFEPGALALHAGEPATVRGVRRFDEMISRREAGEPIQYVLGHWPFRSLDLVVDRRALIPRPETEAVAGRVIEVAHAISGVPVICDLGTGSGAIGLSVLAEHRTARVYMSDVSSSALALARANLAGLGGDGVRGTLLEGRWFEALEAADFDRFDVIVANPPYVASGEVLNPSVADWEPASALLGGPDGLDDLRTIIAGASRWLREGGCLIVEHGFDQSGPVCELFAAAGFDEIAAHRDLAGLLRFVEGRARPVGGPVPRS